MTEVTEEHIRILKAIEEGRLSVNPAGRYVIVGERRPDRTSREQVFARGYARGLYSPTLYLSSKGFDILRSGPTAR